MLENVEIKEYPTDFLMRHDCNATPYCEIAMESFYDAMCLYDTMKKAKWFLDPTTDKRMPERMRRKAITAVVFSAMSAEAFINDYLAVRLGDEVFFEQFHNSKYHYYDKLGIIMLDILKKWDYKRLAWYWDVRKLFELRNDYVHSASKETSAQHLLDTYYDEEQKKLAEERLAAACEAFPDDREAQIYAIVCNATPEDVFEPSRYKVANREKREMLKRELGNARFALTALSDMTRAIEKLDPNSRAFRHTFTPFAMIYGESDEVQIREKVFPELGLKFTKEELERVFLAMRQ